MGLGLLTPKISLPNFYPHGCGTTPFCLRTPPTSLDGCGSFNSIVVGLVFSSISDIPERWLFYISVLILMWLWEEAIHVCLCRHLDQKLSILFSTYYCNQTKQRFIWLSQKPKSRGRYWCKKKEVFIQVWCDLREWRTFISMTFSPFFHGKGPTVLIKAKMKASVQSSCPF